uniref:Protein PRY1-like n=1 Tax=Kryptolebias marmoratus TaxID=37003 RepID=A0A3Q3AHU5_KRYMA
MTLLHVRAQLSHQHTAFIHRKIFWCMCVCYRSNQQDSPQSDGPCNPFSRCFHWCCTHCITQKPSNPEPKPKPVSGSEHVSKPSASANQKKKNETSETTKPSEQSGTTKSEPSAESEIERIQTDFVERVSKVILKQLLDALKKDGVFNNLEKEAILEENKTRADTARGLIDSVKNKGEKACKKMIEHLLIKDPALSSHLGLSFGPSA